jgi:hypothetical protein
MRTAQRTLRFWQVRSTLTGSPPAIPEQSDKATGRQTAMGRGKLGLVRAIG